jgi:hypothetical protein
MSANQSRPPKVSRKLEAPTTAIDVFLGVSVQIARKYMFWNVARKALVYLGLVIVFSFASEIFPPANHYYFVQKHNVFNVYGTKLGWFWTCLFVCPFIWFTSIVHHRSKTKALADLTRMLIATVVWYFCTAFFVWFARFRGWCHGVDGALRDECALQGGKWVPGFDISGHAFILVYSVLLMSEEAAAFRNWPSTPHSSPQHLPSKTDFDNYKASTKIIQALFVGLFVLHLIWDVQLLVTSLYYHTPYHKLAGAVIAVFAWYFTYRLWYPKAFPFSPIKRKSKAF